MARGVALTGVERTFEPGEIIVSKTDTRGRITYANRVFQRVAGYSEPELLGQPHSLVRHPDMPRCVFKFLWDTISSGRECFAYVINKARNGDHYWVFAHVTPSYGPDGTITAYHSNRRVPRREAIDKIVPIYKALLDTEAKYENAKEGMAAGTALLVQTLADAGVGYDEFIFSI